MEYVEQGVQDEKHSKEVEEESQTFEANDGLSALVVVTDSLQGYINVALAERRHYQQQMANNAAVPIREESYDSQHSKAVHI